MLAVLGLSDNVQEYRRAARAVFPGANAVSAGGTRLLDVVVLRTLVQPASEPPAAYGYDGPRHFSGDLTVHA
jgi:hypothetical protein